MFNYTCLNPIAGVGLDLLSDEYNKVEDIKDAQAVLVRSAGIVVFNTPGANANGVKELVFAGMLLAARDVVGGIEWVKGEEGNADVAKLAEKQKKNFAGNEIAGKKLGVIGLGAIGVKVANAATHLGMEVYGYDPYISVNAAWSLSRNVNHVNAVEEIYKNCDYITIHVPLLDSTKKMINAEAIAMMKPTTVVLNFARDLLVDEEAMVAALEEGKIAKYVRLYRNSSYWSFYRRIRR